MNQQSQTTPIDTKSVPDRRTLRFASLADVRAELDRLERAEREGHVRTVGNWTPGQIYGHLAAWASFAYEGFPPMRPPWLVRVVARMMKRGFLTRPMRAGFRMPRVEAGTFAVDPLPSADGLARLRRALDRLEKENPTHHSPLFGPVTREECELGTLRHCELHLSFLLPGD